MITSVQTDQFKIDLYKGRHNFSASGGIVYKILLLKVGYTGVYDQTLTNVGTLGIGTPSTSNVGTDEITGPGYTSGGFTLTNVDPILYTDSAVVTFGSNPLWTSTSFSTVGAVLYTDDASLGPAGRTVAVYSLGGTQTMTGSNFSLILPSPSASSGIIWSS